MNAHEVTQCVSARQNAGKTESGAVENVLRKHRDGTSSVYGSRTLRTISSKSCPSRAILQSQFLDATDPRSPCDEMTASLEISLVESKSTQSTRSFASHCSLGWEAERQMSSHSNGTTGKSSTEAVSKSALYPWQTTKVVTVSSGTSRRTIWQLRCLCLTSRSFSVMKKDSLVGVLKRLTKSAHFVPPRETWTIATLHSRQHRRYRCRTTCTRVSVWSFHWTPKPSTKKTRYSWANWIIENRLRRRWQKQYNPQRDDVEHTR